MSGRSEGPGSWLPGALAAAAGPAAALLHESGARGLPSLPGLGSVAIVALVAGAGLVLGVRRAGRSPRLPGIAVIVVNAPILLFYGFLLAFFGLGGSR